MLPRAGADTIRRRWTPPESGQSPQVFRLFTSQLNTANESCRPEVAVGERPVSGREI